MRGLPAEGRRAHDPDRGDRRPEGTGGARRTWPDERLVHLLVRTRPVTLPAADALIWVAVIVIASVLRVGLSTPHLTSDDFAVILAVAAATQVVLGFATVLYRVRWRVGSLEEIITLALVVTATGVVVLVADLAFLSHPLPVRDVAVSTGTTFLATSTYRGLWRMLWEYRNRPRSAAERVIVFGAGQGGRQVIDALFAAPDSPYLPVALLDDDPDKRNLRIRTLTVAGGRNRLARAAAAHHATKVIIAIPSAGSALVRELADAAEHAGLGVLVLPPVASLFAPAIGVSDIRPLSDEDLLGRRTIDTEVEAIAGYLQGRRVLVTGAGGSIGSELCRQLVRFDPACLVMLDRDESGLHQTQLSIEGRAMLDSRTLVVCDIRDPDALAAVFAEHRPEVVFHAAALKHLPLLEMWPMEAVKTNVLGTWNVLQAACGSGVDRFVNVSTDKAADPTSVLGYTKRLAERLTAGVATTCPGTYLSVRFGNVLGSRGSVLTAFRAQVAAGGPITVTDPEVTRYFMTVEEAVQLVIQAGAVGRSGEALVLDMGTQVKIDDVARRLAREAPRPVEIVYTGLRPGEKLHEDLIGRGEVDVRPCHPLISHVMVPPLGLAELGLDGGPAAVTGDPAEVAGWLCGACCLEQGVDGIGAVEVPGATARAGS